MAFNNNYFSIINYSNGWSQYYYKTNEALHVVSKSPKYFASLLGILCIGDKIMVCAIDGYGEFIVVKTNKKTVKIKRLGGVNYE